MVRNNVLRHKAIVNTTIADDVKRDRNNGIFADVMLRADESEEGTDLEGVPEQNTPEHFIYTEPRLLNQTCSMRTPKVRRQGSRGIDHKVRNSVRCFLMILSLFTSLLYWPL